MGEVWAAVDDAAGGREVAIKVLLQRAAMKPDLVKRFEREAKITSSIQSPFVCKLLGVHQAQDGSHLLIFEQLTGESLADRLKREQYLPLSEVGPLIDDVLQGLVAAHGASVIHRDLKPGNIFIERTSDPNRPERAKILDFGISKLTAKEKEEPTLTAFDATLGSFAYMAPEQIRGAARADERADIYAIGAVAFRALTGRLPFEGTTAAVLVSLKLDRSAPSLEEVTGEKWPAGVERFLERALDRNREGRFGSALEALQAWRSIQPSNITRVTLPPSHPPTKQNPKAKASALTFATGNFPEDATEVDDPPTMTGDQDWPGSATEKRPMEFAGPKTGSRTAPHAARVTAGRSPLQEKTARMGPPPLPQQRPAVGATRTPSSSPPTAQRGQGSPPPPPRPSSPGTRDARPKRTRNGGR
jgi:serine/threonine-protein kinase